MICILDINKEGDIRWWIIAAGFSDAFYKAKHANPSDPELVKLLGAFANSDLAQKNGKSVLPTGHVMLVSV